MDGIKDIKIKGYLEKIKEVFAKMSSRTKRTAAIIAVVLIAAAVTLTIILNSSSAGYVPIYSNLSASEAGSVYQALLDMGAKAKIGSNGSVEVPSGEYDIWILQLAAKGYPKTALPYDIFSSHSGMTTTESEKSQWLLYQLQDRIQSTLERMDCVDSATVTINVPQKSDYVWDNASDSAAESASAGVLLNLKNGVKITGEQVAAIRNLVAASVPKMSADGVKVVDASTMLELTAGSSNSNAQSNEGGLDFELMVQKQIEDNVVRLLSPRFGSQGVVAVAKVTIDYDKMMTEKYDVSPNPSGSGNVTHNEGSYSINGEQSAGSVIGNTGGTAGTTGAAASNATGNTAGVTNNTDIPTYAYTSPNSQNGMTDYSWKNDYDYSYIKTQIQSGNAILKRATISVMVNDASISDDQKTELTNLVSGCTDIPSDQIFVSTFSQTAASPRPSSGTKNTSSIPGADLLNQPTWVYIVCGAGLLLILTIVVVMIAIIRGRKKRKARSDAEAAERARIEEMKRQKEEIENHKKSLEEMAKGNIDPKDEAVMDEVRSFAKSNPQVTASLLKSWLKEE